MVFIQLLMFSLQIADLEITNKSLMSINTSLEATKHRQAKEIRDLRRKLRESRLILPPRQFRAVQSPSDHGDSEEEEEEEEDEDGDDLLEDYAAKGDERYQRVRHMILDLVESGRRALETKPSDYSEKVSGAKVLHAEEVLDWHDPDRKTPVSPTLVAMPDSSDSDHDESEDEVFAMVSPSKPRPGAPTVTITRSPSGEF